MHAWSMRAGISITVTLEDRLRLEAVVGDRKAKQKHVKRAKVILATAGTTTLFAALNILDGTVIGRNMQRHRHQEFIRFLNTIEAQVPVGKVIHAVVDNYATHKHPKVRQWLARHPRWAFHFTPTSASWLN